MNWLIGLGFLIRIFFCFFLFSGPLESLFVPFFETALQSVSANPWSMMSPEHFPYGSFLFACLFFPLKLVSLILNLSPLGIAGIIKLILLCFDSLLLWLGSRLPVQQKRWLVFYWLNPVLIYITYIHGQLDVVSMSLLFLTLHFLLREKWLLSAMFLVASVHSKFHCVLFLPIALVFIWNRMFARESIKTVLQYLAVFLAGSIALALPLLTNIGYATLESPEAQRLFALRSDLGEGISLYWGVMLVLLVLGRLLIATSWRRQSLYFAIGLLFATLLLVTRPAPGWFFWVIPFLALLHAIYSRLPIPLFVLFVFAYGLHFFPGQQVHPFWSLTLLQTILVGYAVLIEVVVLHKQAPFWGRRKPFIVGISGDSGSGKDRITESLALTLGASTQTIPGDNYHRWERGHSAWHSLSHLHPLGNSLTLLEKHLLDLQDGRHMLSKEYDHNTGRFSALQTFLPARNVIVQGLHSLFHPKVNQLFDLKIHLAPSENLRTKWKIQRDQLERGHAEDKVRESIKVRAEDSQKFIKPQSLAADWLVQFSEDENSNLRLRMQIPNTPQFLDFIEHLQSQNVSLDYTWSADLSRIDIQLMNATSLTSADVRRLADTFFPNKRVITRGRTPPEFQPGFDGLIQLFFMGFLSESRVDS